jgi:CBS domain-containing protein
MSSIGVELENYSFLTLLLTSNQDITTRVIARELKLEETPVSKVMTRNPLFVLSDTLAVEALQKMVQGG